MRQTPRIMRSWLWRKRKEFKHLPALVEPPASDAPLFQMKWGETFFENLDEVPQMRRRRWSSSRSNYEE